MTKTEPVEAADFYGPLKEETLRAEAAGHAKGLVVYVTPAGDKLAVTSDAAVALHGAQARLDKLKAHDSASPWLTARVVVNGAKSAEAASPECRREARRLASEAMAAASVAAAKMEREAGENTAEARREADAAEPGK